MKRILIGIIVFLSFVNFVNAKVYYGDYYQVSSKEKESDVFNIKKYMIHKEKIFNNIDMGYLEDNNYYIKDLNDYIYSYEDNKDSDIYYVNNNILDKTTNKITLSNIGQYLKIYEIEVYYKNKLLKFNYDIYHIFDKQYIFDNKIDDNYAEVFLLDNEINIYLDKYYDINDLSIVLYSRELLNNTFCSMKVNDDIFKHKIDSYITVFKFNSNIVNGNKKVVKKYRYYNQIIEDKYETIDYDFTKINDENYEVYEEYYKRDKLELADDIIIDDNQSLYDFIIYSSGNVNISCNKELSENDIYSCIYTLNNIKVEKDIIVNKKVNDKKNDILEKVIKNNEEEKNYDIKEEVINNSDIKKDNKIQINKKIVKENKVKEDKYEDSLVVNKKKNRETDKKVKLKKSSNNKMYFIKFGIFIFLLSIEVLFCIYKKK